MGREPTSPRSNSSQCIFAWARKTRIYSARVSAEDQTGRRSVLDGPSRSGTALEVREASSRPTTASSPASSSAWRGWWPPRSGSTASRRSPRQQARSEQAIARTKAENDWRIARAEILSKNLNVLSTQGPGSADQRFGVLLSLTRGAIIDPELAVSYALELGKDNPSYMRAVLEATGQTRTTSSWRRASSMTCVQRFGVEKAAEICKDDALRRAPTPSPRCSGRAGSDGGRGRGAPGNRPLSLLRDEREVQASPGQAGLAVRAVPSGSLRAPADGRTSSGSRSSPPGAQLVAALVLATARTGELVSSARRGSSTPSTPSVGSGWLRTCSAQSATPTAAASWST